ncbi:MAG: glycosyltransferase family 2 protein [Thermoleophilia bacterium]|nr:glycosyltransferase family 2 protein [Thermoleophilia bacterium]
MIQQQTPAGESSGLPGVGCVLVNYRSPREMLERCLKSILQSSGPVRVKVVLVDNASGDGVIESVRRDFPGVDVIELPENGGFAAAVNLGLARLTEPYVLMLNTDAVLTGQALIKMAEALGDAGDGVAGVAPKMMSSAHEGVIDAIGIVMPPTGASFNRGIGQCDLGQYDSRDQVAGVCFGAALLRTDLFKPAAVGPLYEDYFLYFEDSDWCMRAASQGYSFLTVPEAVVLHMHSGITRHESLSFKYRLIELNTLMIVTRTFESPLLTMRIAASRISRLLARTFIRRRFIRANLSTIASYLVSLPRLLGERRRLKARRTAPDDLIFRMAAGEDAYFDTVNYRPQRCLDSLIDTYQRLAATGGDPRQARILAALNWLKDGNTRGETGEMEPGTMDLLADLPPCATELLSRAAADRQTSIPLIPDEGNQPD